LYGTYIIQGKLLVIRITNECLTTIAILSNSWMQHLKSLAGNDETNKNIKAFSEAFVPATTVAEQVATLVEEIDTAVLPAGPDSTSLRTHSWTKFGGTRSRASATVACLVGTGPRANVVIVDCSSTVVTTIISIPRVIYITSCVTVQDLEDLAKAAPAPATTNLTATPTPPTAAAPTSTPATPTSRTTQSQNARASAASTGAAATAPQANTSAATTQATTTRNIELSLTFIVAYLATDFYKFLLRKGLDMTSRVRL
jgi:hypothetical protein